MMYEVVLQLQADIAAALHEPREDRQEAEPLQRVASQLHVELVPQHPGTKDEMATFFSILVSDAESAQQIANRFKPCAGVDAVYVKPQGGSP